MMNNIDLHDVPVLWREYYFEPWFESVYPVISCPSKVWLQKLLIKFPAIYLLEWDSTCMAYLQWFKNQGVFTDLNTCFVQKSMEMMLCDIMNY